MKTLKERERNNLQDFNIQLTKIFRMKLITHNVLSSKGIKGVKSGYPLKIEVKTMAIFLCLIDFFFLRELPFKM